MEVLMAVLAALLGLAVLIVVHELGHFVLARLTGMRVLHFAVGFGPSILTIHGVQTRYTLGLLPIGGAVRIAGQSLRPAADELGNDSFLSKPLWARAVVVLGGPLFNMLLALGTYVFLFASFNTLRIDLKAQPTLFVRDVRGPAAEAGLRAGDALVALNGTPVTSFSGLMRALGTEMEAASTTSVRLTVARPPEGALPSWREEPAGRREAAGEWQAIDGLRMRVPEVPSDWPTVELEVRPERTAQGPRLGLAPELARFGTDDLSTAAVFAWRETWAVNAALVNTVGRWVKGEERPNLVSPVKVTQIGADSVKSGLADWYLNLFAMLSLNLAIVNLLPLPALDGGRLLFLLAEGVMRRPVPARLEAWVHAVGFVLFFALVLALMVSESLAWFRGA
jgi:regulator of sigma E protease